MAARISYPIIHLRRLLGRPGGKTQDEAIAAALAALDEDREMAADALEHLISQITEKLCGQGPVPVAQMTEIIDLLEQIGDLAANYGPHALDGAISCLLDAVKDHDRRPVPRENLRAFAVSLERLVQEHPADDGHTILLEHLKRLAAHCRTRPDRDGARKSRPPA